MNNAANKMSISKATDTSTSESASIIPSTVATTPTSMTITKKVNDDDIWNTDSQKNNTGGLCNLQLI